MKFGFVGTCFISNFISKLPDRNFRILTNESEVKDVDTIIFTGGGDVNPVFYGEKNRYSGFEIGRDLAEFTFFDRAIQLGKNIIGVCRGHQLINVALGGDLYQDIRMDLGLYHRGGNLDWKYNNHLLSNIFINVNSMHHQAVKKIGKGLIPVAFAKDGIIESMICPEKKIITFQFHPELLNETKIFFNQLCENELSFY